MKYDLGLATVPQRISTFWEIYGDWNEDPAQPRTDVLYRLK
jgi:hypothetical protein